MIRIETAKHDELAPGTAVGLHRHANAYAAIVLDGDYEECGLEGRHACVKGRVVVHPAFHAHADQVGADGALIFNVPLQDELADLCGYAVLDVGDASALARAAAAAPHRLEASLLGDGHTFTAIAPPAWLTAFLSRLLAGETASRAAAACGRTVEHAGRVCRRWFAMTPVQLRREARIREAIDRLRAGGDAASVAHHCGFADQPHLTRTLKTATGRTPARLFAV